MTGWSNRGDCFVASLLAMTGKKELAMTKASVLEAAEGEAAWLVGVGPAALPTARAEVAIPSAGSRDLRGRPKVAVRTEVVEAAAGAAVARRQSRKTTRIRTIP